LEFLEQNQPNKKEKKNAKAKRETAKAPAKKTLGKRLRKPSSDSEYDDPKLV